MWVMVTMYTMHNAVYVFLDDMYACVKVLTPMSHIWTCRTFNTLELDAATCICHSYFNLAGNTKM